MIQWIGIILIILLIGIVVYKKKELYKTILAWVDNTDSIRILFGAYGISTLIFIGILVWTYQKTTTIIDGKFMMTVTIFYIFQLGIIGFFYEAKKKLHQKKIDEIKARTDQFDSYLLKGRSGLDAPYTTSLYSLAEESMFYYIVADEKMRINQKALDALDYSEGEFEALELNDLVMPEGLERIRNFIKSDILNERIESIFEVKKKNGEVIVARFSLIMLEILDNRVVQGVVRDIAEKEVQDRRILKIESLFQALMQNSEQISFFSLDAHLNYTMYNEKHRMTIKNWFGIEIQEGLSYYKVFNTINHYLPDSPISLKGIEQGLRGKSCTVDEVIVSQSNEKRFFKTEFGPVYGKDGQVIGITVVAVDVTPLEDVKQRLKIADRAKTQFLANMSHEIRTPMNGIIGFTDIMMDTPLNVNQKRIMRTIRDSSESLLHIINEILDFSKIESQQIDIQNIVFELPKLIESVKNLVSPKGKYSKTYIDYGIDERVPQRLLGDPLKLRQILINIIGNAIKFTEEGSVWLQIKPVDNDLNPKGKILLLFEVMDTGVGIQAEELPYIFDPFKQANGAYNRSHSGTGLGLSITKQLVEAMGGTITVKSIENQGSTFRVILPFGFAETERVETEIAEVRGNFHKHSLENLRILIAEDNEINQMLIAEIMKINGVDYTLVSTGQAAYEATQEQAFDLILMDISMPIMDGIEATHLIKSQENTKQVPIIALTAHALVDDQERLLAEGFEDYLPKPLNQQDLIQCMAKWTQYKAEKEGVTYAKHEGLLALEEMLDGNKHLVLELGKKLLEQFNEAEILELRHLFESQQMETLADRLHKLKGAVLNFDLKPVLHILEQIKESLQTENEIGFNRCLDQLTLEMSRFEKALEDYRLSQ